MKTINLKCPQCSKKLTADVEVGDDVWCPDCGEIIPVQDDSVKRKRKQHSGSKTEDALIWVCALLVGTVTYYVIHSSGLKSRIIGLENVNNSLVKEIKSEKSVGEKLEDENFHLRAKISKIERSDIEIDPLYSGFESAGHEFYYAKLILRDDSTIYHNIAEKEWLKSYYYIPCLYVLGEVINSSGKDYEYVSFNVNIYDKSGYLLDSQSIMEGDVLSSEKRSIKVPFNNIRGTQVGKYEIKYSSAFPKE